MKRFIDVHRGEIMAGQGDVVLKSDVNDACLVIVAYDAMKRIGGLAHAVFLGGRLDRKWHSAALRNASEAIDEMILDMKTLGSLPDNIEVSLVAGENVPHEKDDPKYHENITATIDLLRQKRIKIRPDHSEETDGHHVQFDVNSGSVSYAD